MDNALGIIERIVIDHQARMRCAFEQAHQFAEWDVALDRDYVGAMNHDIGDAPFMKSENIAQHRALDGRETDLVRCRGVEYDLQVVADRSRLPAEQRANRPR